MATGKTQAPNFEYVFPSIRGIQAGREYYVSMCPLRLIPKIFLFDEVELVPELRAQRVLNKNRVPEMAQYMVSNRTNYVFSALTASIDGKVRFIPSEGKEAKNPMGLLHVPMDSRFIINDGQHRRAAIEAALKEEPKMGDETIAVVFLVSKMLSRCLPTSIGMRYALRHPSGCCTTTGTRTPSWSNSWCCAQGYLVKWSRWKEARSPRDRGSCLL